MKELAYKIPSNILAAAQAAGVDIEAAINEPLPDPVYDCAYCQDMGVVSVSGDGFKQVNRLIPCPNPDCPKGNAQRLRVIESRYKNARIPLHYSELTFERWDNLKDKYKTGKLPAAAAAYLFATKPDHTMTRAEIYGFYNLPDPYPNTPDRPKNCIMLFGAVGMGKTGLMASCANHILSNGGSLVYIRVVDLIAEIQKRYGADEYPTSLDVIEDFKTFPLLFLDEFEVVNDSPDRLEKIETIVEARRAAYLPTFMTTNLTQEGFRVAWGDRAGDRVVNMSHWIPIEGLKLRQTEKPLKAI